jgi:FAD:protein FMN transferase
MDAAAAAGPAIGRSLIMTIVDRRLLERLPNRREFFLLGLGGFIAAVPFARRNPLSVVRRNFVVMGTLSEIVVAHRDPQQAQVAIDAAVRSLEWVDQTMTAFSGVSDVGRANRRAAREAVAVAPETSVVLSEALSWADSTDGVFDPCLGKSTELWDVKHRHQPPGAGDVSKLANRKLYRSLEIAQRIGSPVVRFHDADVRLDLGAIAKGYGVDRAVVTLREHGVTHALVGAGGDLYALGRSPSGDAWQVGIQSPDDRHALAGTIELEDAGVATSGDYEQFFVHKGRRYHHIVDPTTGEPGITARRSVTVVADTCMAADAGATAAFLMTGNSSRALAEHGARVAHIV